MNFIKSVPNVMCKFFHKTVYFWLYFFAFQANGADTTVVSQKEIDKKIDAIYEAEKDPIKRANLCFQFAKFLKRDRQNADGIDLDDNAILRLRQIVTHDEHGILDIFKADLEDQFFEETIINRLMRSELNQHSRISEDRKGLDNIVGHICDESGKVQLTGIFIPVPIPHGHGTVIKWHVLTAAHLLNSVPIYDTPHYSLNFRLYDSREKSIKFLHRITEVKVFKRTNRDIHINGMQNSMSLTDIRAKLNYDEEGDVALCGIEDKDGKTHQFLTDRLLKEGAQPALANNRLEFTLKDGSLCALHLIYGKKQAETTIQPGKSRYHLLGYKLWVPGSDTPLIDVLQRSENLKVKDEATFRISSDFNFFLDIPAYHGMSGGPIFYTKRAKGKADEIHIFGVTNAIGKSGERRLLTRGAFIRPELFHSIIDSKPLIDLLS